MGNITVKKKRLKDSQNLIEYPDVIVSDDDCFESFQIGTSGGIVPLEITSTDLIPFAIPIHNGIDNLNFEGCFESDYSFKSIDSKNTYSISWDLHEAIPVKQQPFASFVTPKHQEMFVYNEYCPKVVDKLHIHEITEKNNLMQAKLRSNIPSKECNAINSKAKDESMYSSKATLWNSFIEFIRKWPWFGQSSLISLCKEASMKKLSEKTEKDSNANFISFSGILKHWFRNLNPLTFPNESIPMCQVIETYTDYSQVVEFRLS